MVPDVFISYSRTDRVHAVEVVERLRAAGVSIWIDLDSVDPTTHWGTEIVNAIHMCKLILLLASPRSLVSPNVGRELAIGLEKQKPLLPVYIEPSKVPPNSQYALAGIEYVELFDDTKGNPWGRICQALKRHGIQVKNTAIDSMVSRPSDTELFLSQIDHVPVFLPRNHLLGEAIYKLQQGPLPVLVLQGLVGIGKTLLMAQLARTTNQNWGKILAISLDGPGALEPGYILEEINRFLIEMGRGLPTEELTRERPERVLAQLGARIADLRILLLVLLDGVDDMMPDLLRVLLRCLAKPLLVRVVVTTRTRIDGFESAHFVVPELSEIEAVMLITEYKRLFSLDFDPEWLIRQLPVGIRSHPQALLTLLAQLVDFPIDILLSWGLPEEVQTPARLVQKTVASLKPEARRVLAIMRMLSGFDLVSTTRLLQLVPPSGFVQSLKILISQSLVYRATETVYFVPALVAEALAVEDHLIIDEIAHQIADLTKSKLSKPFLIGEDAAVYAALAVRVAHHLTVLGRRDLVHGLFNDEFLEWLNLRGFWKEYSLLVRLSLDAARATNDRAACVQMGFRLVRKLVQMGDLLEARREMSEIEKLIDATTLNRELGELHSHRAMLCQASHDDGSILGELLESRRIRRVINDITGLAVVEKQLGGLYLRQKDFLNARQAFSVAMDLLSYSLLSKHRIDAAIGLAVCDLGEGKAKEAETRLHNALTWCTEAQFDTGLPRVQINLALALELQGRADMALDLAREALKSAQKTDFATMKAIALVVDRLTKLSIIMKE